MGMTRVSNLKACAALLVVGLLGTLLLLALSACGGAGGQEQAKARSLPLYENALRPGEYHSVKFKPPLSFKVGKGWSNTAQQLSDYIELGQQGEIGFLTFANVKEVWKPGTMNVVDAPKDLVEWLQQHPYLETSKPEPVTLGGVKGEQLEVLVEELPKDYYGLCGTDCVDIAPVSNDEYEAAAYFRAPLCQAALLEGACESATRLLKTASEMRLLRHRSASLWDLPSATFLR